MGGGPWGVGIEFADIAALVNGPEGRPVLDGVWALPGEPVAAF